MLKIFYNSISALDPAFPGFYGPFLKHITKDDAEFVDVIHTDAWIYGAPASTGTVDFWPNSGSALQPGCPTRHDIFQLDENGISPQINFTIRCFKITNKFGS